MQPPQALKAGGGFCLHGVGVLHKIPAGILYHFTRKFLDRTAVREYNKRDVRPDTGTLRRTK